MNFKPGDRVQVQDEGLSALNKIMGISDEEATNNKGVVALQDQDLYEDSDSILIEFDDGGAAPYPLSQVKVIA